MRPGAVGGTLETMDDTTSTARLEARRAELVAELARVDADLDAARAAKTDGTDDDEHDPEGATTSAQWSHATGMRRSIVTRLDEVDRALERVAMGSYGTCVRCGRPIGEARLEARPAASLCIDCARETSA